MKTAAIILMSCIAFAGCATMGEIYDLAKEAGTDAAIVIATETEAKLAAVVKEETGKDPGTFENLDGSTNWAALLGSGPAAILGYLGWRRVRKMKEGLIASQATEPAKKK